MLLSSLPWHDTFYRLLNHAAELTLSTDAGELDRFLECAHKVPLPDPGGSLRLTWEAQGSEQGGNFVSRVPAADALPAIPLNVRSSCCCCCSC